MFLFVHLCTASWFSKYFQLSFLNFYFIWREQSVNSGVVLYNVIHPQLNRLMVKPLWHLLKMTFMWSWFLDNH